MLIKWKTSLLLLLSATTLVGVGFSSWIINLPGSSVGEGAAAVDDVIDASKFIDIESCKIQLLYSADEFYYDGMRCGQSSGGITFTFNIKSNEFYSFFKNEIDNSNNDTSNFYVQLGLSSTYRYLSAKDSFINIIEDFKFDTNEGNFIENTIYFQRKENIITSIENEKISGDFNLIVLNNYFNDSNNYVINETTGIRTYSNNLEYIVGFKFNVILNEKYTSYASITNVLEQTKLLMDVSLYTK